jgi:predicted AlkP superfamily phosphohydrolase/phosphomutase
MSKVFVFGIDGAPPELIFDKWNKKLPNLKKLMDRGCYAKLNSTIPPSTIVAWNSMMSGKDTSEVGVFSYTYKDHEGKSRLVNSNHLKCRLVWDILSDQGKRSAVLYVPLSYPVKPINGIMVSDFLTPGVNSNCTYPSHIKEKIKLMPEPEIFFDVAVGLAGHKGLEVDKLIEKTYVMTDMQIKLLKESLKEEDWDFFMSVMIGTDRLQHMLWNHFDETHRRYIKDSKYKNALLDYYIYIDKKLGEILELLDEDTTIIVASDHGMVKQEGKININNWLIKNQYLVLKENINIEGKTRFNTDYVDFEKTLAYGGGAYNARIYLNKKKLGNSINKVREDLIEKIKNIPDDKGKKLETWVYKAEDVYKHHNNKECPDLTVYFDNLRWASNPDLGQDGLYSWHTAVGADSAGHSRQGSFILVGPKIRKKGFIGDIDIRQVAPTVLKILDAEIPSDIEVSPLEVFK